MCMTAAAPIMKDTLDFFMSLNLPLMEIYGMSETSGMFCTDCNSCGTGFRRLFCDSEVRLLFHYK